MASQSLIEVSKRALPILNSVVSRGNLRKNCTSAVAAAISSSPIPRRSISSIPHCTAVEGNVIRTATEPQVGWFRPQSSLYFSSKPEEAAAAESEEVKDEAEAKGAAEGEPAAEAKSAGDVPEGEDDPPKEEPSKEEQLEVQVKDLKDQLLRSLAEQDNTRRIAQRDVESARMFAIKSFANSLLDVSDNLGRAIESVPEEIRSDKEGNPELATLYEGIVLTDRELTKAFAANGLVKYGKAGELFDPNTHDALYEYADAEKTPGTIGQVMKPGFMLNKRVLRPAKVGVVKKQE